MDFIEAAIAANQEIFKIIRAGLKSSHCEYHGQGAGGDRSSGIDLLAEEIFVSCLAPFGTIHSEESGIIGAKEDIIILDPIDGSDNLLSGLPYYGTSLALVQGGRTEIAITANLANGDLFVADSRGVQRADLLNLDFQKVTCCHSSKVGIFEKAYANLGFSSRLIKNRIKFRSPGAVALSLAYAHSVDFVLFAGEIREYDMAAGLFICKDLPAYVDDKTVLVCKDPEMFKRLQDLLFDERNGE